MQLVSAASLPRLGQQPVSWLHLVAFALHTLCTASEEVLIGWRVKVQGLGEGIVTAIRKRHFLPTLFQISGAALQHCCSCRQGS